MQIVLADETYRDIWDSYVLQHPGGVAYQLFGWKNACRDGYGLDCLYLLALENGTPRGILPLIRFKIPFQKQRLISLPYCDVGGILADNDQVAESLLERAVLEARFHNITHLELRDTENSKSLSSSDVSGNMKVRMVLELPGSSEELLKGLKSKLRSQVKKPIRDGLSCRLGGAELCDEFYDIFTRNMRDLGSPVHGYKWISSILYHYDQRVRVGVVYTQTGEPAAAGIILMTDDMVSIPWASSLRHLNRHNPNMLLYWTFLSFAADNHFRYFDFGRSTPGEGTYRFKEQWGAKPVPLKWQIYQDTTPVAAASGGPSVARQAVEKAWSRMPQLFCDNLGPALRRYISL